MGSRTRLSWGIAVFALILGIAITAHRREPSPAPIPPKPKRPPQMAPRGPVVYPPEPPAPVPVPGGLEEFARAIDETRLRDAFISFRDAVAQDNVTFQRIYRPVLLEHRAFAVRLAQEHLAQSRSDFDRHVAERTLDALRR